MAEPNDDPLVGSVLAGRYEILGCLGSGAMGSIYRAQHATLGRAVAVKVLAPELARDPKLVARFLREAQAAASVSHGNTVDITDVGELPEGGAFFVMELLEGRDLSQVLAQDGRLAWPRALAILVQITSALAATHEAGIVHRDMKPANVFLTYRRGNHDFVKIIDFGVAKVKSESKLTKVGMVLGTASYMAPEQIMSAEVDGRTDIYAVCCMLFEMLTGRRPFIGDDIMKILAAHIREPPPPLREVAPDVEIPAELEALILRGLAKLPEHRFANMVEFGQAIAAIQANVGDDGQSVAPSPGPAVAPAESTVMLDQPDIGQRDPSLDDDLLANLAYLFVAFVRDTIGALSQDHIRTLTDRLQIWAPNTKPERLAELLAQIVTDYAALPGPLGIEQTRYSAERLGFCLSEAQQARALETLRSAAAADGQLALAEQYFIDAVARSFELRRDPRLRACAALYLVVAQATDGINTQEMQVVAEQLRRWMPDASLVETDTVLRETVGILEQMPRAPDRLAHVLRCADRLAATTGPARLREVLGDLWRIAGVDGQIAAQEQRLIMDIVDRFGTLG